MTSPSTFNVIHTISEVNRDYPPEQSQQCPASCPPSLQHHPIPTNSPSSSNYKVSLGGCDGTNINNSAGATNSTAHQSFSHPSPVSLSQSNTVQAAHGTILRQDLQYNGTDTTDCVTYSPGDPEASGVLAGAASGSHLNTEYTTDSINYFSTYPEVDGTEYTTDSVSYFSRDPEGSDVLAGVASGSHLNTECTTNSVSYFSTYPEAGGVFTGEAFDICSDSGAAADTVNCIHHYT